MARLYSTGFELNSLTQGVEIGSSGAGTRSIQTTIKRSGNYALRCNPTSAYGYIGLSNGAQFNRHRYLRFYIYIASSPSATTDIAVVSGIAAHTRVKLTTARKLQLTTGAGVQQGSDSGVLNLSTWYRVELKVDNLTTSGTCVSELKLDGTTVASGTYANTSKDQQFYIGIVSVVTADIYLDDVALNDNLGTVQNSFPGAGSIIHLKPNGAGDASDLGAYTNVDEATPNDVTDYNSSAGAALGATSEWNLENTPGELDSAATVTAVQVGFRKYSTTTSGDLIYYQIKASSGGSLDRVLESETATYWSTNREFNDFNYSLTSYTLPSTSTPWSKATLDTAQIGWRVSSIRAGDIWLSTMWVLVEYIPSSSSNNTVTPSALSISSSLKAPSVSIVAQPSAQVLSLLLNTISISTTQSVFTVSGAGDDSYNGGYVLAGTHNGQSYYTYNGKYLSFTSYLGNNFWLLDTSLHFIPYMPTGAAYYHVTNITGTYNVGNGTAPGPTVTSDSGSLTLLNLTNDLLLNLNAPIVAVSKTPTPSVMTLTLALKAPTVEKLTVPTPPARILVSSLKTPVISITQSMIVEPDLLALVATIPAHVHKITELDPSQSLSLTLNSPIVSRNNIRFVETLRLAFVLKSPTTYTSEDNIPDTQTLSLSLKPITIAITVPVVLAPPPTNITSVIKSTYVLIRQNRTSTPSVLALSFVLNDPTIELKSAVQPSTLTLSLVLNTPVIKINRTVLVASQALTLTLWNPNSTDTTVIVDALSLELSLGVPVPIIGKLMWFETDIDSTAWDEDSATNDTDWNPTTTGTLKWYRDRDVESLAPIYNDPTISYSDPLEFYSGRDTAIPIDGPDDAGWSKSSKNTTTWS